MTLQTTVKLGEKGRLNLPVAIRRELGFSAGDELVASVVEGALLLEPRETVVARVRARFAHLEGLADELIKERREEALKEQDE